jgi:hypothetical protein
VFDLGDVPVGVEAFGQVEVLVIIGDQMAVPGVVLFTDNGQLLSESLVILLHRNKMHSTLQRGIPGGHAGEEEPMEAFSALKSGRREFAFATAAFTLCVCQEIGIGVVTMDALHRKL